MDINEAIEVALKECTDPYALQYLNTLEESKAYGRRIGREKDAYEVQLHYAYSNMEEWQEGRAREVKSVFKEYLKDRLGDAYYEEESEGEDE